MKQRTLTGFFIGLVYSGVILGSIYFSETVFDVFVLFLMMAAGTEVCRCLDNKVGKTIKSFVIFAIIAEYVVYALLYNLFSLKDALIAVVSLSILLSVLVVVYTMFANKHEVSFGAATALTIFYPVMFLFFFMSLGHLEKNNFSGAIIITFISTSLADMMAYFIGSLLKGPKLCPAISPQKTVSGAIGGLFGGVLSGIVLCVLGRFALLQVQPLSDNLIFDLINWIAVGMCSALFCEFGDLISSYMKRVCGIKDFGNLLAGHGGIMDRIDGLIFSAVFIFAYFSVYSIII